MLNYNLENGIISKKVKSFIFSGDDVDFMYDYVVLKNINNRNSYL